MPFPLVETHGFPPLHFYVPFIAAWPVAKVQCLSFLTWTPAAYEKKQLRKELPTVTKSGKSWGIISLADTERAARNAILIRIIKKDRNFLPFMSGSGSAW